MSLRVQAYCYACGDPIWDGEYIYMIDPSTRLETSIGGEPHHDECCPSDYLIDSYNKELRLDL